jgi:hypothetical protein
MNGKGDWPRPIDLTAYKENYDKIFGYKHYIRDCGCLVCGTHSDPHHVKSRGAGGKDERNIVPLCRVHHTEGHTIGWKTFQKKYGLDLKTVAVELWDKYHEGDNG